MILLAGKAVVRSAVPANNTSARHGRRYPTPRDGVPVALDDHDACYVVHIPITVPDLAAAMNMAREMSAAVHHLAQASVSDASVSHELDQANRHPLFCNRRLPDESRCLLPPGHSSDCGGAPWPAR